jgi:hypothetical protein
VRPAGVAEGNALNLPRRAVQEKTIAFLERFYHPMHSSIEKLKLTTGRIPCPERGYCITLFLFLLLLAGFS